MQGTSPIQKVKTSSSLVTCVPLPVASPRPSCARHHAQKHSQANKHKRECQEADNGFFSLSSMTSRSNWFCFCETLYFSNFRPCLKLLDYIPTCQDSSAGHSSKGWALRRERRQKWVVLNSNRLPLSMDPSSLLHPAWPTLLVSPSGPPYQAPQALQLNWPDKAFCSVVAPSPHRAHSWCWEFLPGTSKRAGLNSSFEARPRSLSLGERRSHENSSETSAASKHSCLPWELRSALQTHLPLHLQSSGDPESSRCLRWRESLCPVCQLHSAQIRVPPIPHPIPALHFVHTATKAVPAQRLCLNKGINPV